MNLLPPLARFWHWLGTQLMRNWLLVLAACLLLLAAVVVFSGKKSQDAKEAAEGAVTAGVLTTKQVKRAEKVIAAKNDSIQKQTVIIKQVVHTRDSLKVVAKRHDARADSLVKTLVHEAPTPDAELAPERVAQLLSDYKPKAWALEAKYDSLR